MEPNDILEHPCQTNQAEVPFESHIRNTVLSRWSVQAIVKIVKFKIFNRKIM